MEGLLWRRCWDTKGNVQFQKLKFNMPACSCLCGIEGSTLFMSSQGSMKLLKQSHLVPPEMCHLREPQKAGWWETVPVKDPCCSKQQPEPRKVLHRISNATSYLHSANWIEPFMSLLLLMQTGKQQAQPRKWVALVAKELNKQRWFC